MAFPTLPFVTIEVAILVVGAAVVYWLSRALKIRPKLIAIGEPTKEATLAIIVYVVFFVLAFAWFTLGRMFQLEPLRVPFDITQVWVLVLAEVWGFADYCLSYEKHSAEARNNRRKQDGYGKNALGAIPSVIYIAGYGLLAPSMGAGFVGFSPSLAYAAVFYTTKGFSEEAVFRGYIQTRLTAFGGSIKGLVAASLIFASVHLPTAYFLEAPGDVLASLAWAFTRLPVSLFFGYMMLKSQNIIPPSIFHLFVDWNFYLWRIP